MSLIMALITSPLGYTSLSVIASGFLLLILGYIRDRRQQSYAKFLIKSGMVIVLLGIIAPLLIMLSLAAGWAQG